MQGFYANLLTKNISMGGDVDANALSAFTAGSVRQTHVSGQGREVGVKEENVGTKKSTEAVTHSEHQRVVVHAVTSASQPEVVDSAGLKSVAVESITDESALPVSVSKPVPVPLSAKKDEEQLMSAKERYLARKRKAEEGN
jgi:hypothetical protein